MTAAPPDVAVFTDGACRGNPGPGGWAAVLLFGDHRREISGGSKRTTNNIMEMTAAVQGLRLLKKPCRVVLYSDSQYLIRGMTEWLPSWARRGWRRAGGQEVANLNLWQELQRLNQEHEIAWRWIPAHHDSPEASMPENALCDKLAREASQAADEI